eukprot:672880-Pyramimonas_sp.AAC.1
MVVVNGYSVDAKGYMVDVKGYSVGAKAPEVETPSYTYSSAVRPPTTALFSPPRRDIARDQKRTALTAKRETFRG